MIEFKPGDEVCVQEPQSQDGRWVFPGERLFVQIVNPLRHQAFVRCPTGYTSVWVSFENLFPPSPVVNMRTLLDRVGHLERRVAELEDAAVDDQDDELDTPEVVSCDCPRSDDDVHEQGCVNHPAETAAEPLKTPDWRDHPHSLPPATTEGVECPACTVGSTRAEAVGNRHSCHISHATQEDVDECVRRQTAMGWRENS
jgi:hypothetical protein